MTQCCCSTSNSDNWARWYAGTHTSVAMTPVWRSESVGERTKGACISDGCGLSVAAGEGCGNAGEQQIEEAVQFGGAVVGG